MENDIESSQIENEAEIMRQKTLFQLVFSTADGKEVLEIIKDFCFADETKFHENALEMARRTGRDEVWLAIEDFLTLPVKPEKNPGVQTSAVNV